MYISGVKIAVKAADIMSEVPGNIDRPDIHIGEESEIHIGDRVFADVDEIILDRKNGLGNERLPRIRLREDLDADGYIVKGSKRLEGVGRGKIEVIFGKGTVVFVDMGLAVIGDAVILCIEPPVVLAQVASLIVKATFVYRCGVVIIVGRIRVRHRIVALPVATHLVGVGKSVGSQIICNRIPVAVVVESVELILIDPAVAVVIDAVLVDSYVMIEVISIVTIGIEWFDTGMCMPYMVPRCIPSLRLKFMPRIVTIIPLVHISYAIDLPSDPGSCAEEVLHASADRVLGPDADVPAIRLS